MRTFLFLLFASAALADPTPYSVASLVDSKDEAAVIASVTEALHSTEPLVRTTAARVAAIRGLQALLPQLREQLAAESDATAAREEIRALALVGSDEDIALAAKAAARWPASVDNALAIAVARRGDRSVIESYVSTLRNTRMNNTTEFFRVAFWGRGNLISIAAARMLSLGYELGWRGILDALEESQAGMDGGVLASSLTSRSEEIRAATLWYLVRGYAIDPSQIPEVVKSKVTAERSELSSNREDFGLELLRRMLGGERKDSPRWLEYLGSEEADVLMRRADDHVLQYLTDEEYSVRYKRCEVQLRECVMPAKRSTTRTIPSQRVSAPAFNLPELLPAGLADAIMTGAKCNDDWLSVAGVSVDPAGRVKTLDLGTFATSGACKNALDTLLRLSFATNTSLRSPFEGRVLLVHPARASLCLNEDVPREETTTLLRSGGDVEPPKIKKRVEPHFPESARRQMGGNHNVILIAECVISKEGCVRSVRLLTQTPYPELNGAAVMAISQWTFAPGRLDGQPVDVIFNVTVNFTTR